MLSAGSLLWGFVGVSGASLAIVSVVVRSWCLFGCTTRQPKSYGDDFVRDEEDPLLRLTSPVVYYHSGAVPDFQGTLYAIACARTSTDINYALPGPALEWMFTTSAEALEFVTLCRGHIDFSVVTVNNLASLVVGLQRFASDEPVAEFITDCFRAKQNHELLRLKHEIEKRVPVYDVVYRQIQSKLLRECVLTHLELQARLLKATPGFQPPVKLLSEIDDTLFAVQKDTRYPNLTVYPGVQQFAKEVLSSSGFLNRNTRVSLDTRDQRQVFFTERAALWRQQAEDELEACGFDQYTLMTGTIGGLFGGAEAAFRHKLETIHQYKRVFGECELVFVGNNGTDGVPLGQELLRSPHLYSVSAVLIHDVLGSQPQWHNADDDTAIRFFRTYVGAAFQLCQLDLLSLPAAVRVAKAASTAFRAIPFAHSEQLDSAASELAAEIVDLLADLSPREANALAALMPKAVMRLLADRLPTQQPEDEDDGLIV